MDVRVRNQCGDRLGNQPAPLGTLAYGETQKRSRQTDVSERPYYIHVQYLTDLKPNTTYHYRPVVKDERGNVQKGPKRTFTTRSPEKNVIHLPGDVEGPPYELSQADTTYVLNDDITADGTAIQISAPDITLDLGGHTITYQNSPPPNDKTVHGIRNMKQNGVTFVNGIIRQSRRAERGRQHNPSFMLSSNNMRIAGVTVDYHNQRSYSHTGHTNWNSRADEVRPSHIAQINFIPLGFF